MPSKRAQTRYYKKNKLVYRDKQLKAKYGISLDDYTEMLKKQNGVCLICGKAQKKIQLAVDHCHTTGKIRGLLCGRCNVGVGFVENLEWTKKAMKYVLQTQ